MTQFFWATCFFFLLRGLRSRRPADWALEGLAAGLSEYFYYGTRLLPFILLVFLLFVLAVHWQQARQHLSNFLLLAGSYFIGFGPLLFHFIRNPNLYFGRGASLLIWPPHIPTSFSDIQTACRTIWPVFYENLLAISTHPSQDIIFSFYVALAVPVGAWTTAAQSEFEPRLRWIFPITVAIGLVVLGWCNLNFYFHGYNADPESLKSKAYRSAQRN